MKYAGWFVAGALALVLAFALGALTNDEAPAAPSSPAVVTLQPSPAVSPWTASDCTYIGDPDCA